MRQQIYPYTDRVIVQNKKSKVGKSKHKFQRNENENRQIKRRNKKIGKQKVEEIKIISIERIRYLSEFL